VHSFALSTNGQSLTQCQLARSTHTKTGSKCVATAQQFRTVEMPIQNVHGAYPTLYNSVTTSKIKLISKCVPQRRYLSLSSRKLRRTRSHQSNQSRTGTRNSTRFALCVAGTLGCVVSVACSEGNSNSDCENASNLTHQNSAKAIADRAAAMQIARDQSRHLVQVEREIKGVPGISIVVRIDDEVVMAEGYGYADVEHLVPMGPETHVRIASVSKPITALTIATLVHKRLLHWTDAAGSYLPMYSAEALQCQDVDLDDWIHKHGMSVAQLAGHTSGIRHYKEKSEMLSSTPYEHVKDTLAIFGCDALQFMPGSKYEYSTFGYTLLSLVVEYITELPFEKYASKSVLQPLGLYNTFVERPSTVIPNRARYYHRCEKGHELRNAPYVDVSSKIAGGGFTSTAYDVSHLGSQLIRLIGGSDKVQQIISPQGISEMLEPLELHDGSHTKYGLGFTIVQDHRRPNQVVYRHCGGAVGASCTMLFAPSEGISVAVLTNLSDISVAKLAMEVLDQFSHVPR
jgi:serine beta-lactamase-like protein LACTB, mitochondrial